MAALIAASFGAVPAGGQAPAGPEPVPDAKSYSKLDSALAQLVIAGKSVAKADALPSTPQAGKPAPGQGEVRVIIEADPSSASDAAAAAERLGATIEIARGDLVQATVPVAGLEALSQAPGVSFVRRPMKPVPYDEITSQAVNLISANTWQAAGFTGAGVKVAILDIEFENYASLLGTELPASVMTHWSPTIGGPGSGVHGTACAEIIHDIAPDAQLYLVNVWTEAELASAVDWLIDEDVDIISHSVGWYISAGDGTGFVDSVVDTARAAGILWINAAGNDAQRHWAGTWTDTDGDGWLDFATGVEGLALGTGAIDAYLRWDDPWGASNNDYDLYLFPTTIPHPTLNYSNPDWVDESDGPQNGTQDPIEAIEGFSGTASYYLAIHRYGGTDVNFDLFTPGKTLPSMFRVAPYSMATPADSANALAAGAVYWNASSSIEPFSSQGPTRDGRPKPDLVAHDGVSTASYGGSFYGTSAATPHVAGAAALVKEAYPAYGPGEVQAFLEGRAVDLGAPLKDNVFGSGRLQLGGPPVAPVADFHASATNVQAGTPVNFTDDSTNAPTSWAWDFDDNGTTDSTAQNPSHTYNVAGSYSVKLTATNDSGSDTETKLNYITVSAGALHHITVSPPNPSVAAGAGQVFTATGYDQYNNVISPLTLAWSVSDAGAGAINVSTGSFTAGTTPGSYSDVIGASSGGITGTASVTVTAGPLHHITVSPSSPTVVNGGTQSFTATGYDQYNNVISPLTFTWSVTDAAAGAINGSTGLFMASTNAGVYNNVIRATSGAVFGTASVNVLPPVDHITVSPSSPTVGAGQSQTYTATGYDQYDNVIVGLPIAWSVANPAAGAIDASTGVFTAAGALGSYSNVIQAASGSVFGTASVTVATGPLSRIAISPSNPSVALSGSQAFTAQGYDSFDNPVGGLTYSWSLTNSTPGSIEASTGVFTANTHAGTFVIVQATSGGVSGVGAVTVTPGELHHIIVTPPDPYVVVSTQQSFYATGYDQYENVISGLPVTWSVLNPTAGTINPTTGVFTAGNNEEDFIDVVQATSGAVFGRASVQVMAAGTAVVNGSVSLQGGSRPAAGREVGLTVKLFNPGTSDDDLRSGAGALVTYTPNTQDTGSNNVIFQVAVNTVPVPGAYDITTVSQHTLMNVRRGVTLNAGANAVAFGALLEGNCNNDTQVNSLDFSTLVPSYLKATGQPGFDARADFDRNGVVNALDLSLLAANYLKSSPLTAP